jgi:hypothetical protein
MRHSRGFRLSEREVILKPEEIERDSKGSFRELRVD